MGTLRNSAVKESIETYVATPLCQMQKQGYQRSALKDIDVGWLLPPPLALDLPTLFHQQVIENHTFNLYWPFLIFDADAFVLAPSMRTWE